MSKASSQKVMELEIKAQQEIWKLSARRCVRVPSIRRGVGAMMPLLGAEGETSFHSIYTPPPLGWRGGVQLM